MFKCPHCKRYNIEYIRTTTHNYENHTYEKYFLIVCVDCERILKKVLVKRTFFIEKKNQKRLENDSF